MALYALQYRYVDDAELVSTHRPEHRAYLRGLAEAGELLVAGPLGEPGPPGGLLVLDVSSAKRAEAIAQEDPFTARAAIASHSVQEWTISVGGDRIVRD